MTAEAWAPVSAVSRCNKLGRLGDRQLFGCGDHGHARPRRIIENVEHPLRLIAHEADLHQIRNHPRRTDLTHDVATRLGVDDHEVVVPLAHFEAELPDAENFLHAGRGIRHEVEGLGQRADPADERDLDEEPQILPKRIFGTHRHREQVGRDLGGFEPEVVFTREQQRGRLWRPFRRRAFGDRLRAATSASAAAIEVLPTPPLPVTQSMSEVEEGGHVASASCVTRLTTIPGVTRQAPSATQSSRGSVAEANLAGALSGTELDVGNFGGWHCNIVSSLVGDPQRVGGTTQGCLDACFQIVAICVVGEFKIDLTRGLGYSDAYVHAVEATATPPGQARPPAVGRAVDTSESAEQDWS